MPRLLLLLLLCWLPARLLAQQSAVEPIVQTGHLDRILALAYAPNGQFALSGSADNTLKLWSISSGYEIRTYYGHTGDVRAVAFHPDGETLASGGEDGTVRLWDRRTGQQKALLTGHTGKVNALAFSPDGKLLATGGDDLLVRIWDVASGKLQKEIKGHKFAINAVTFSKDGLYVASAGSDPKESILFDLSTGAEVKRWTFLAAMPKFILDVYVFSIQLSDDNRCLLSAYGTSDESANAFSVVLYRSFEGDKSIESVGIGAHGGGPVFARLMPDQKHLLTGGRDKALRYWDIDSMRTLGIGKQVKATGRVMKAHRGGVIALASSPDGKLALSASRDNTMKLWDIATGREIRTFRSTQNFSKPLFLSFVQGGKQLLIARRFQSSLRLDLENGRMSINFSGKEDTDYAAVSPDGKRALSYTKFSKEIKVWNLETGALERTLLGHLGPVTFVDFAEGGKVIISSGRDKQLIRWDAETGAILEKIPNRLFRGAMAGDNRTAVVTQGNDIQLVDFKTGQELKLLKGHSSEVLFASISQDASRIVSAAGNEEVFLWDATAGTIIRKLTGHSGAVVAATLSPDGTLIATATEDGTIRLWDANSGDLKAEAFTTGEGDYLIRIPGNYYTCSRGAARALAFRKGEQMLPFEAFDLKYNRPDLVLARIGLTPPALIQSYQRAYQNRLKRLGYTPEDLETELEQPVVELPHTTIPLLVQQPVLKLPLTIHDPRYQLRRLEVLVNDVPVNGKTGFALSGDSFNGTIDVPLGTGPNEIVVVAYNERGVASIPQYVEVNYDNSSKRKPVLYVLAVGVSAYQQSEFNLTYANKDANDLIATLKQTPELYSEVKVKVIGDAEATREAILAAKQSFLSLAGIDDQIVIFIAGHGLLAENYDYYFATHDIDFANPAARGLSYDDLEGLLDGLKPLRKLLLMDTCHSGEVDDATATGATPGIHPVTTSETLPGERVTARTGGVMRRRKKAFGTNNAAELARVLFTDMRQGTGTVVISSAGGNEFALESALWNNGVFTYCVLSGLKDRKADYNTDGKVVLSELQRFVISKVPRLTEGRQTPTSRAENLRNDFRIW